LPLSILVPELVGEASSQNGSAKHSDNSDPNEPPLPAAGGEAKVKQVSDAGRAKVIDMLQSLNPSFPNELLHLLELKSLQQKQNALSKCLE
jgi:hypothetical protein